MVYDTVGKTVNLDLIKKQILEDLSSDSLVEHEVGDLQDDVYVNLTSLKPETLIIVKASIGIYHLDALIDSGASNNLIKASIVKEMGIKVNESCTVIKGLGNILTKTLGDITASVSLFEIDFEPCKFVVVEDSVVGTSVILGARFLKSSNMAINMARRILSVTMDDNSKVDLYVKSNGELQSLVQENVPVYSLNNFKVEGSDPVVVPVHVEFLSVVPETSRVNFHFQGISDDKRVQSLEGIIAQTDEVPFVMCKKAYETKYDIKIRKGEKLGYINTVIELDESEEELKEKWTIDEIQEHIKLGDKLSSDQQRYVYKMLYCVQRSIGKSDTDIGKACVSPHTIEITNNTPIWQKPRRFAEPINKEIERQCSELKNLDIIEDSKSQWSSPVVPVRKKNGELRLCIDYRKVNSVTKQEKFPMPNLADSIYSAYNMKYFTSIDLIKGYYQVAIDENSRHYTAFSTPHNHFQFKRLSFGLRNSGIAFQRNMQEILADYCFKNIIVYIDDILIMTATFEEHLELVEKVLNTLGNNGIKINIKKCEFFQSEVSFLGHIISNKGIMKSPQYIDKISQYPKPKTITELRQFLGLVNFQRKFIDQCSVKAKPLSEITGGPKKMVIEWTDEMNEAYEELKARLVDEVVLAFPNYNEEASKLELFVDASGKGVGGCLVQEQEGVYRTIGYASMTFSEAQSKYSTIERELVAIRWGIKAFRAFLFGVPFLLYTDHKPLLYLHNMSRENSRLMRTINELSEYDFQIKYRPGSENCAADAMSRIVDVPTEGEYSDLINSRELPKGLTVCKNVDGGGNSLFESLFFCLSDLEDESEVELPGDHLELRKLLVEYLIDNSSKYGIQLNKNMKHHLKLMRHDGQLPCEGIFLVACDMYKIEIWVHHGIIAPVIYKPSHLNDSSLKGNIRCSTSSSSNDKNIINLIKSKNKIHLQCISGIHFNPVVNRRKDSALMSLVTEKNINEVGTAEVEKKSKLTEEEDEKENIHLRVQLQTLSACCNHEIIPLSGCVIGVRGNYFCAIVDTGAQVSVISEQMYNCLLDGNDDLVLEKSNGCKLKGLGNIEVPVLGVVKLRVKILDVEVDAEVPFAVIQKSFPCC